MVALRFGVLGPLEVACDGLPLRLGGVRRERLLAAVLMEADRVLPLARLIDVLWEGEPPRTAKTQVHKTVLALRRLMGSETLVTDAVGYRLRTGSAEIDAREFTAFVDIADEAAEAGRLADAVTSARAGLGLWRGPALAGMDGPVLRCSARRLDEQRVALLERCLAWELELGRDVRAELSELVSRYPLQERFRGQLMLALHRSGRQGDALAVYDQGRRLLAEELGLDPGPELRAAHALVLKGGDTVLSPGRKVPMTLPYDVPAFTGRPSERRRLLTHRTASHGPAIHVIEGMAGVGKTALAVHAAHELAPHYPDGQLFIDLCGFAPDRTPTSPTDALDALLRAIGVLGDRIPYTGDERVAVWRTELTDRRMLIVLDNAADAAQVTPLIPASVGSAVIITSRRRLTGLAGATPITLDVLPEQDATLLVRTLIGPDRADREPEALARLAKLCGFLPLAIRIAAARLQRRPQWTISRLVDRLGTEQRRLAELAADTQHGVATAFAQSYHAISADQQRLFRLLGLHPGLDLDVPAAAAMADLIPDHVEDLLQQLVDEHLLQESVPGRFTYHDLLRAHARRLAEAADPEQIRHAALSRLFDHYRGATAHAVDLLDPQDAPRRPALGRRPAIRPFFAATATAREWLDREVVNLVTVATQPGWPAHSRDMSVLLAAYLEQQARHSDALAVHSAALVVTVTSADKALTVRNLGRIHLYLGRLDQARRHFTEALDLLDEHADPLGVVTVMNDLAITHTESGRYAEANAICVRALEICADTGDSAGRMRLLMTYGNSENHLGRYSDASTYLHQSLRLAEDLGHHEVESKACLNIGDLYTKARRHDDAIHYLRRARDLFRDCGNAQGEAMARANLGGVLTQLARHDEAAGHLEPALVFFREAGNRRWEGAVLRQLGTLANHAGRHREAIAYLEEARIVAREIGMPSTEAEIANLLGDTCRNLGQPHHARDHYRTALTIANAAGQRHDEANAHRGLGHVHDELGNPADAQRHWRRCVALYGELDLRVDEVRQLLTDVC